jgi:hypothetical protein
VAVLIRHRSALVWLAVLLVFPTACICLLWYTASRLDRDPPAGAWLLWYLGVFVEFAATPMLAGAVA